MVTNANDSSWQDPALQRFGPKQVDETETFRVLQGESGVSLVVTGAWTEQTTAAVVRHRPQALVLNYAFGFEGTDLEFLDSWPSVRRVELLDHWLRDVHGLRRLGGSLTKLTFSPATRTRLDLGDFPRLAELGCGWDAVKQTIDQATRLSELTVSGYGSVDLTPLSTLVRLESLCLKGAPRLVSLDGLAGQPITKLCIGNARMLTDLSAVEGLPETLTWLELDSCKRLESLESLASLTSLRHLIVGNCPALQSYSPLAGLRCLTHLGLWGTTRTADLDLSPLLSIPGLEELAVQGARGYTPSAREVMRSVEERKGESA